MARRRNRYGLSRHIPEPIKRQLRQEAGFGCVICGNAIYQYEHIIPEFPEAQEHNPDHMTILCSSCHDNITRGVRSKQKAIDGKRNPKCKQVGGNQVELDVGEGPIVIELGGIQFVNTPTIIEIEGQKLLGIEKPEQSHSPPLIIASFFNRYGTQIASITNNCWEGSSDAFDIKTSGNMITIRSQAHKVDLCLEIVHPNRIIISKINMFYKKADKEYSIVGDHNEGFVAKTPRASMKVPTGLVKAIENSPPGLSLFDGDIQFGADYPLLFTCINFMPKANFTHAHFCEIEFIFAKDHPDPPPDVGEEGVITRITNNDGHWTEWAGLTIEELPDD